jgi:hypothetical protein
VNQLTEAILWVVLLTAPNHARAWPNPLTGEFHTAKAFHQGQSVWSDIYQGIDFHTYGPGDRFDWTVVSYRKDPFSPLKPLKRTVTHHDRQGRPK